MAAAGTAPEGAAGGQAMSEPGSWSTPDGWGPPGDPAEAPSSSPPGPAWSGQSAYGSSSYGSPSYGSPAGGEPFAPGPWGAAPQAPIKPGVVPLRPLGLGEVLDGAVGILRRYPRPALGLSAIVAVVSALVNAVVQVIAFRPLASLDTTGLESGNTDGLQAALGGLAAGGALAAIVALLSTAIMTGAITAVVGRAVLGQPLSFAGAWALVRPRILPLVGLSLLVGLVVFGTMAVAVGVGAALIALLGPYATIVAAPLIVAGIVYAVFLYGRLALAPCALVLERSGIRASMRRSSVLVKRDWWRVVGILVLTAIIGTFVSGILSIPFGLAGAGSVGNLFGGSTEALTTRAVVLGAIGSAIAATLVTPFTTGVRALLYVDRRIRAEGLDVALAAAATAGPVPTA